MTTTPMGDGGLEELGTPPERRAPTEPRTTAPVADATVRDPHGAADPIPPEEYVGRRGGLRGVLDTVAYGFQLAMLSLYGPAAQSAASDPVERLKRKYGRPTRRP